MAYLLDTSIVSDLVRHPQGKCATRLARAGERNVVTSIIVAAELRYGAARRGSARLSAQLEIVLDALAIVPLDSPVDRVYGALRSNLEKIGQPIGPNDLLIAAQAIALGHILVTDNEGEFSRVEALPIENWLR
jgi:tRNA(fMet)-specific endonuclease VapC